MDGDPCGYISTSALMQESVIRAHAEHSVFTMLNDYLSKVLNDMGVANKVRCGCIVRLDHDAVRYFVVTKVMAGGSHFIHEELWSEFPSDHFKTKVLLAAG
jgi:hypothetical protein